MGSKYTAVLFHRKSRWRSRGKVRSRVLALKDEIRIFLEEEGNELASKFNDEDFLMKLAYLSNMFEKLNELNLQLYFSVDDSAKYNWIRDPFVATPPATFSTAEEEQHIEMTSESTMRLQFTSKTMAGFWIGVRRSTLSLVRELWAYCCLLQHPTCVR